MGLRDSLVKEKAKDPDEFAVEPLTDIDDYPLTNYRFILKIGEIQVALFQKVSSISVARKTEELVEGGFHEHTFEFPKHFSYNHLKLELGLASSSFCFEWMMQGKESGYAISKDIIVEQLEPGPDRTVAKTWKFNGGVPVKWQISDLSINNSKSIVVEKLEISFNDFELS